ncbi:MAG: diaminopimelate epimerase [Rhodospirillaceae bacterium]|nr:diaminopimelate epimerase [Rhodospirillaceae bacterium]
MYAFTKQQAFGNDFVVIDGRTLAVRLDTAVVRRICDRRFGVGCDQLIVLRPAPAEAPDAAAYMQIFNADGGEVEACGNATRGVAQTLMAEAGRGEVVVVTRAGRLACRAAADGRVTVDMGPVGTAWSQIPLARAMDTLAVPLGIAGLPDAVAVNIGNPHAVHFMPDTLAMDVAALGPQVEHHPLFPERTNAEFATLIGPDRVRMRIWERGAGETGASGSGACATAVAAARRGLTGRRVEVVFATGSLSIAWLDNGRVEMTGGVETSFTGVLDPGLFAAEARPEARPGAAA